VLDLGLVGMLGLLSSSRLNSSQSIITASPALRLSMSLSRMSLRSRVFATHATLGLADQVVAILAMRSSALRSLIP
jgi:hypothetical protein